MKHNLKFQLTELQKTEQSLERATYKLARDIFVNQVCYELVALQRDQLFVTIENVKQRYKDLFSFHLHYAEASSLDNAKREINDWIETAYKEN